MALDSKIPQGHISQNGQTIRTILSWLLQIIDQKLT